MGFLSGRRPPGLGYEGGAFKPCSWKPNCVSSTALPTDDRHHIAPLRFIGPAEAAWARLLGIVKARDRVAVIQEAPDYLHAEFKSRGLGYIDDVEFALDTQAGVVHVRSASRLGVRDFGVNRARVESLRAQFAQS